MKTTSKTSSSIRDTEMNAMVLRLELIQKDIAQLRGQLNSYRCEPRTYGLFEYIESLKHGMERLTTSNSEIIDTLREKKRTVTDYFEEAKVQMSKYNQLKNGVEDYRTKCMGY